MSKNVPPRTIRSRYSDQEIYEGLLSNQRDIVAYFYQDAFPLVRAQLSRMGAEEEGIKDFFQEGMVVLWRNIQSGTFSFQTHTKLSTYLVKVCKNMWLEKRRKAQSRYEVSMEAEVEHVEVDSFLDRWFQQEEMEIFQHHFQQLGKRCQEILRRFYFKRESMKQIAQAFQLKEATAKNEKYRCMQRLKLTFESK